MKELTPQQQAQKELIEKKIKNKKFLGLPPKV
jgi:hypothetical protein